MKDLARTAAGIAAALLTALGAVCVAARLPEDAGTKAAEAAAGFLLPAGNEDFLLGEDEEDGSISSSAGAASTGAASTGAASTGAASTGATSTGAASAGTASAGAASAGAASTEPRESGTSSSPSGGVSSGTSPSDAASSGAANQKTMELNIGSGGTAVGDFWVKNRTENHASLDLVKEMQTAPALKAAVSGAPQVLIYHTHTTESYDGVARTNDLTRTVCAVGDAIAAKLESAGVGVVHDKTVHDYPAYDGSYDRSKATIEKDLKQYPSLRVTLDIHRDAMHRDDGTMLKPVAVINGKKAAQVMILAGCDDDGTLEFPNWEQNLRLALRLQKQLSEDSPGLARPLDFCARRYNEDLTNGSLLIEIGTDANTLGEAEYAGELVGASLARVLAALG